MIKTASLVGLVVCAALFTSSCTQPPVRLNAAGATFPYPVYSKWFSTYGQQKGVEINYQSIGSGGGIQQLTAGTVDFGASDKPLSEEQAGKISTKVLHFPTVLGAVVPVYNLSGVEKDLNFTGEALAGIFSGRIKKWNDAAIKADNPGVTLPSADIVIVHRSDGSGTTFVFTDYLAKVSDWKTRIGDPNTSVNWPTGLAAKGNEGVAGLVKQTPNSIGYVELIYALQNKMGFGAVKNAAGSFVKGSLAGVTAAAAGSANDMPADFRVSITNAPGADAYPISTFTWLLVPATFQDAGKRDAVKSFLQWMLTEGQNSVESLNYARLPQPVIDKETKQIDEIK